MFLLWSHCDHLINRRQVRCIVLQGVTGIDRTSDIIPDLPFDLSTFSSFFVSFSLSLSLSLSLSFRFSSFSCMKLGIVFRSWCRFSGDEGIWKKGSSSNLGINETFPFLGTNPLDWSNQSPRIYHSFPYHLLSHIVTFLHVFAKNFLGRFRATNDLHRLRTSSGANLHSEFDVPQNSC